MSSVSGCLHSLGDSQPLPLSYSLVLSCFPRCRGFLVPDNPLPPPGPFLA